MTEDYSLIKAAFGRVAELERIYGNSIPSSAMREGFYFGKETVQMENQPRGIFKPRQMKFGALSIKTSMKRDGSANIYNDQQNDEGYYHYALQAGDPHLSGNKLIWQSYKLKQPFIYFHAIAPAVYTALWPCFVDSIHTDVAQPFCKVLVGNRLELLKSTTYNIPDVVETRYQVRETKVRLHQASFREAVLNAYQRKCAITGISETKLIEAAHIVPDAQIGDQQLITNGIALNRLHHKAYDSRLIGIDPDYKIHVSNVLKKQAGNIFIRDTFLEYEGRKLIYPRDNAFSPDRELLARRFEHYERQKL